MSLGITGSGKTVLNRYLLRRRKFVVVLGVKARDPELYGPFEADGYKLVHKFDIDEKATDNDHKVLFVPLTDKHGRAGRLERATKFRHALNDILDAGKDNGQESWTVYADDLRYQAQSLGLQVEFEELWQIARSSGISMVSSAQEPVMIPPMAYTQARHIFIFRFVDRRRVDRLAEIGGVDGDVIRAIVPRLPPHQFLYVSPETAEMMTSIVIR